MLKKSSKNWPNTHYHLKAYGYRGEAKRHLKIYIPNCDNTFLNYGTDIHGVVPAFVRLSILNKSTQPLPESQLPMDSFKDSPFDASNTRLTTWSTSQCQDARNQSVINSLPNSTANPTVLHTEEVYVVPHAPCTLYPNKAFFAGHAVKEHSVSNNTKIWSRNSFNEEE